MVVFARIGPERTLRGSRLNAASGTPRKASGFLKNAAGLTFKSTSRRTPSSVSRKRNRVRSIVPNRLPSIGNGVPLTRRKRRAGPSASINPGWTAAASRNGSISDSIVTIRPCRFRSETHSASER